MINKGDYLNALESAIRIRHKCSPAHRQTVFVQAKTEDEETVWEGLVEEFELAGHKRAKTCYAWRHTEASCRSKIIVVLENRFIDSPKRAVEAAIFADAQPPVREFSNELKSLTNQIEECKKLIRKMGIQSEELSSSIDASNQIKDSLLWKNSQNFDI